MKKIYIFVFCFVFIGCELFGHDQIVHRAITINAAAAALNHSFAFNSFINVISPDRGLQQATNGMSDGSFEEDDGPTNILNGGGGWRSLNHFYDPLDASAFHKSLSDAPPDRISLALIGNNSFVWGSTSNCLGIDYRGTFLVSIFGGNVNTSNIWSWPNARYYEWLGLTAITQIQRQTNLDNMFRAVGQVIHLLQDTSQPQHVRNEQHVDKLGKAFWESPIEDYGNDNVTNLNYGDGSMLSWQAAGFTKLEDFWDRHKYAPGSSDVLIADNNENP